MNPWEVLARAKVPGSGEELTLHRRGHEYHIKVDNSLLMSNLTHDSEARLAEVGLSRLVNAKKSSVLVGGLGMGFTLAAALRRLGPESSVHVAELVPAVVEWNQGLISHLAGHPLRDPRVKVLETDVGLVLRNARGAYDAILQDVDNGPRGLTVKANAWLYSEAGLRAAALALRPHGVLAFWADKPDRSFLKLMRRTGFEVKEVPVRGRDRHRGAHHVVWLASL
jgi:spermidine synthase